MSTDELYVGTSTEHNRLDGTANGNITNDDSVVCLEGVLDDVKKGLGFKIAIDSLYGGRR
ncbi:hypothetical protein WAI453_012657 [Rhynchosporium graminicola]